VHSCGDSGGAVFEPAIIDLVVVEAIFLPGAFGGWETPLPLDAARSTEKSNFSIGMGRIE
jgi:hypothetical protein